MKRSRVVRSVGFGLALTLTAASCGDSTNDAASEGSNGGPTTSAYGGPPTGTVPQAPPRSNKPAFTGEAAAVEKSFRALVDAFDRKDAEAAIALNVSAPPRDGLVAFMNTYSVRLYRINAIAVKGTTATVDYEDAIVARDLKTSVTTLLAQHDVWKKQSGLWKQLSSDDSSTPGIPSDLATVTVTLRDHAATLVPTPLPTTDFAFVLKNTGNAAKGVFILGIPANLDVAAFLPVLDAISAQRDDNVAAAFPDGVLEMGATPDTPAHGTGTMVFTARLPKGRYLLLSRGSEDDPTPRPEEYADFTVT